MTKFFVKLGLRLLTVVDLIAKARLIVTKMTGNSNFTAPDPPLAEITAAADALDVSRAAVASAKSTLATAVSQQNADEEALQDLLTKEGKYVDIKTNGDKVKIESAGMDVSNEATPVGDMPKVDGLSLTHGDSPTEVDAHWHSLRKSKNYTVQVTADPIGSAAWATRGNPTKSSITIDALTSGQKVWVQVCANGTAGPGPFSDPVPITVP
jgi:hypothetical protein